MAWPALILPACIPSLQPLPQTSPVSLLGSL